jgi:hypothetical protein
MFRQKIAKFIIKWKATLNFFTYVGTSFSVNFFVYQYLYNHNIIDDKSFPFVIFTTPGLCAALLFLGTWTHLARGLINSTLNVNQSSFITEAQEFSATQIDSFVATVFWSMLAHKHSPNFHTIRASGEHLTKIKDLTEFSMNENYLNKLWLRRDNAYIANSLKSSFQKYYPLFEKEGFIGFYTKGENPYLHYLVKFMLLSHGSLLFNEQDLMAFYGGADQSNLIGDVWVVDMLFSHDIYTKMPQVARDYYKKAVKPELLMKYQPKLDLWDMQIKQKDFIATDNLSSELAHATTDVNTVVVSEELQKLDMNSLPSHIQIKFSHLLTLCAELNTDKQYVDIQTMPDVVNIEKVILPKYLELFKSYKGTDEKFLAGLNGIDGFLTKAKEQMLIQKNSSFETYQNFIEQKFSEHMSDGVNENVILKVENDKKTLSHSA